MKIALWTSVGKFEVLAALAPLEHASVIVADDAVQFTNALAEAAIVVTTGGVDTYSQQVAAGVSTSRTLQWIHLMSAGHEGVDQHGLPAHILLTGPGNGVSRAVAEHAFSLLWALARKLPIAFRQQGQQHWDRRLAAGLSTLQGKTLLVTGFGSVGQAIGGLGSALGMHVIGLSRSGRPNGCAHEMYPADCLLDLLPRADAIIVALPLRSDTAGLFNADAFDRCKAGALFINVGRGGIVDHDSLIAALCHGNLGGAALDVTMPEPLPAGHPLWTAPNVLITPHVGGAGDQQALRMMASEFAANIQRLQQGRPLLNLLPH
jgi:phosphoglycerate dehydrogenase-like enzyme